VTPIFRCAYFFGSFFMSGEDGVAVGPLAEPEAEPDAVPEPEGGVPAPEDGEDDGALEAGPFFEASSPQAARANAAAAAISRALVIPVPLRDGGAAILGP
jgi:hypothetical protein